MPSLLLFATLSTALSASASRWNCTSYPTPPVPTDVAKLNPSHVGVVMAMGDSITAAFAIRSGLEEGRDISWSIGTGTDANPTLPYFLSQYSPGVTGMSTKAVLPAGITHLPDGDYHPKTDHLNVAESSGAVHRGSLDQQWGYLQEHRKDFPTFDTEWKVLTVWMTANDVCGECDAPLNGTAFLASWVAKTDELLQNVSGSMQKVYVNLVSTLDLSNIARIQKTKAGCKFEHKHVLKECGCIDRGNATQLAMLDHNVHTMNDELHGLAAKWRARLAAAGRTDMAVIVQSYQEGIGATLDYEFLNTLDCFHPGTLGHALLATGLWNSMLCVDGRENRCGEKFSKQLMATCPTADSVFYTGPDVIPGPPPAVDFDTGLPLR